MTGNAIEPGQDRAVLRALDELGGRRGHDDCLGGAFGKTAGDCGAGVCLAGAGLAHAACWARCLFQGHGKS